MSNSHFEREPIRPNVLSHVGHEVIRGVAVEEYGFHGTSVYTLVHMIRTGVIPGQTTPKRAELAFQPEPGDLYFWKNGEQVRGLSDMIRQSQQYARVIAKTHRFLAELNLPFDNEDNEYAAMELANKLCDEDEGKELIDYLHTQGVTERHIEQAIALSQPMSGVLVGISSEVEAAFSIIDCNKLDDGWKIETKQGLPYRFIRGIQFLSNADKALFNTLISL